MSAERKEAIKEAINDAINDAIHELVFAAAFVEQGDSQDAVRLLNNAGTFITHATQKILDGARAR